MLGINSLLTLRKVTLVGVLRTLIPLVVLTGVGFATSAMLTLAHAGAPTYITFDVQGAGTGFFIGTFGISIAPDGTVVGFTRKETFDREGFVRDPSGKVTLIDAPNAGTGDGQGTHAYSIAPNHTISGFYFDAYSVAYSYVRAPDGAITVFTVPGAGTGAGQGTISGYPLITPNGTVAGYTVDSNNVEHGFLRDPAGGITVFDVPAAPNVAGGGTQPAAISVLGVIVGYYFDVNLNGHGFIRSPQGSITTFDVQGAAFGTYPQASNPSGAISGVYVDANGTEHCFVRTSGGAVTTIDAPSYASAGSICVSAWVFPDGSIAATYAEAGGSGNPHAFLRDPNGAITDIDVPGPGAVNGTEVNGISANGVVTGDYRDSNFTLHGYIRIP